MHWCSICHTTGKGKEVRSAVASKVTIDCLINSIFPPNLFRRWEHIRFSTIHGLIVFYGFSILASTLTTCWTVQMTKDNSVLNIEKITHLTSQRLLRILLLVLTPIIPLCIIFKSVRLSLEMKSMITDWRKKSKTESASSVWMKIDTIERRKNNVRAALSKMKTAETNLEGFVQVFVLLCFYFIPILIPKDSGLGFEFDPVNRTPTTWFLLIFAPSASAFFSINASVHTFNASKGNQLNAKSQVVIGFYIFFQIAAQMFRMVTTVLYSVGDEPALSPKKAALLLCLPVLLQWFVLYLMMPARVQTWPDTIEHLVSNLWMVSPARVAEERNQIHKSREQTGYLLISGTIMTAAIGATALLLESQNTLSSLGLSSASYEFLVIGGVPAFVCFCLSCLLLAMYYRHCHNWRHIGSQRNVCCCCNCCYSFTCIGRLCRQENPVQGEIPFWEVRRKILIQSTPYLIFCSIRRSVWRKPCLEEEFHKSCEERHHNFPEE